MQSEWQPLRAIAGPVDMDFRRARPFSIAVVLIAIATALLCALMPMSAAASGAGGSAFNPANSVVTLNAPAAARAAIKRMVQRDDADPDKPLVSGHVAIPAATLSVEAPGRIEPFAFELNARAAALPAAPQGAAYPRGPPQA